jgi:hypothetical protein
MLHIGYQILVRRTEVVINESNFKLFQKLKNNSSRTHIDIPHLSSLESRLNVEADRLATKYMKEDLTRRPRVALFPSAKAQLIIQNASVTRKIPQAIRYAVGSKDIQSYLMERNMWSRITIEDIHWDAHGASHSHHRPQRCFLVKLCHRHLPLGVTLPLALAAKMTSKHTITSSPARRNRTSNGASLS